MLDACSGKLKETSLAWDKRACVCVVISAGGYPGKYETGKEIQGLDKITDKDTLVFHAGTTREGKKIVTAGGRVLGVVSLGETIEGAIEKVYRSVEKVSFEHCFFRRDIGQKALVRKVA